MTSELLAGLIRINLAAAVAIGLVIVARKPWRAVFGAQAAYALWAARWWDPNGPMRPLHRMNPTRVAWIIERAGTRLTRALIYDAVNKRDFASQTRTNRVAVKQREVSIVDRRVH